MNRREAIEDMKRAAIAISVLLALAIPAHAIDDYTINTVEYSKTVQDVILTAQGGAFDGATGRCFLTVHYINLLGRYYNPDNAL